MSEELIDPILLTAMRKLVSKFGAQAVRAAITEVDPFETKEIPLEEAPIGGLPASPFGSFGVSPFGY